MNRSFTLDRQKLTGNLRGIVWSTAILVLLSGLLFTIAGCALPPIFGVVYSGSPTISSYLPSLTLDRSPRTIKARVSLSKFVDQTPNDDRDAKFGGVSVTRPGALVGELATGVTNAVLSDFRDNRVFDVIEMNLDNSDFIIKGRIQKFTGKGGPNALLFLWPIGVFTFFGVPIQSVVAEVQLEMVVVRPDGTEVGRYSGRSYLSESFSIYGHSVGATPRYTNTAFANAVQQIREQLLADESTLTKR